ncbi:glycosyltransferase family 4 protein [Paraburkholderia sp. DHOC27]|uniref:glycosyltransferase family 4 protein n=1 Tax=Paraburkholderia sp. DHOC27 TaxID=2303330 RepID=UPI00216AB367|nr:glycosyltransferase family 4 protein [Paraburkholderia sp. DHOC27]
MNSTELTHAFPLTESNLDDAVEHETAAAPTVLFVDQSGQLGGAEFSLLPLATKFRARGEVVLLSEGPFRTRLEDAGVHVKMISDTHVSDIDRQAVGLNWLRALPGIVRSMREIAKQARRFDVLFLNTQKAMVLGALGKPLHRRPVIWHLHDILTREHFGRVQLTIVKWLVRYAIDHVVANSRATADSLVALTGKPAAEIPVVHNGIDVSEFSQVSVDDMQALRRRLGLPEHAWLAGLFGRLAPWKGQHIAIAAVARLPDVHLVLVGADLFGEHAYATGLRQLVQQLGIADRVHFAGFRDDMPTWMKAMDVILHTSTEPEPFGRVIVEGMAAARPVIAAAAGGVTEILRHRKNGWLVTPGDVTAFVDAIETLRAAPELAERIASQAFADAQRDFSLEGYLAHMTKAITHTNARGSRHRAVAAHAAGNATAATTAGNPGAQQH